MLVAGWLLAAASARAADYYLSPRGDDGASGRDPEHAWKSWKRVANRTVLAPGNRVRLLDGTYPASEIGALAVDCTQATGLDGTPSQPVVLEAVNERRAFLKGDGAARVLWFRNCSYYRVEGLRIESDDNPRFALAHGVVDFEGTESRPSVGVALRRNLIARNNRYGNSHLVQLSFTRDALIEENELYNFHRLGILLFHSTHAAVRRNYINSRGYPDVSGGRASGGSSGGDESFSCYPCAESTFENNISEGSGEGFTVNASGPSAGNVFLGNVSLNDSEAFRPNARGDDAERMPRDTKYRNDVGVGVKSVGFHNRATKNTDVDHVSLFLAGASAQGFVADGYTTGHRGDRDYRFICANSVVVAPEGALSGVNIAFPADSVRADWSIDHVVAFGMRKGFSPASGDSRLRNASPADPGFGACRLWCPDGAACKGAASDGGDLGATVLYRYEKGAPTDKPLWDPTTGAFLGAGAVVPGVNDVAGSSLLDVHTRLNVNQNGCRFPAGYPSSGRPKADPGKRPAAEPQSPNPR
jgi:hypothetical protein